MGEIFGLLAGLGWCSCNQLWILWLVSCGNVFVGCSAWFSGSHCVVLVYGLGSRVLVLGWFDAKKGIFILLGYFSYHCRGFGGSTFLSLRKELIWTALVSR